MANTPVHTGNWFVDQLSLYQSANSNNQSIKNNFVVRQAEFDLIISELKNKNEKDPLQHELLLGRRGSGKSTLLRRIQAEIEENKQLQKKYIAINLAEEQAAIYRLFDLWDEVLKEIAIKFDLNLQLKNYSEFEDDQAYTRYLYEKIHGLLAAHKIKALLLLDNFDRIVSNFTDDGNLLRELLLNHNDIQIIAGSTRMDEHFWQYDKPFYEFFRRHRLEALNIEEITKLLNHWSKVMQLPQLARFAKQNIGKIEAIRILTDGLPRTLQFFIQLLLQNADLYGYDYLRKVMDNVTAIYQERLNNLPAPQRKIIAEMAFIWEACATKDLVEKCRMESKLISAHIKQLSNAGIIDTITTDKKNHLYRISERFFNMWLIITQGNPEQKRKAKWLSIFLETWYDATELKQMATRHLSNLENKKIGYDKALIFTKAFSQSRYITIHQRDQLLDLTLSIMPHQSGENMLQLPKKYAELSAEIISCLDNKDFEGALKLANDIENEEDGIKFFTLGIIYKEQQKFDESEKFYLLAIEKGYSDALNNLGNLYSDQQKFELAEKYYLLAIEKRHVDALFNLGNLYSDQQKFEQAEKYYLLAIEKEDTKALNNLANAYYNQQKFELAEKYYLLAIEKEDISALYNLGNFYKNQQKFELAEKYYLLAIEKEDLDAPNNLGNLYADQQKFELAEKYYLLAIEKGHVNALNNLGNAYYNQQKFELAEKYYLLAIKKAHVDALFNLGNLYSDQQKFELAEKYYLLAIEKAHVDALFNLGILYSDQQKFELAEKYYLLAIEKGHVDALFNLGILYTDQQKFKLAEKYYLLAIEEGDIEASNNLGILYQDQQKFELAEKYYLLAIEKGNVNAHYNLSLLYYKKNSNSNKALELITKFMEKASIQKDGQEFQLVIETWNGVFANLYERIKNLLVEFNYDGFTKLLNNLLYQEQAGIVLKLFNDEVHGQELQKRYTPLYYAVLLLNNKTENNLTLRIPPEIMATVNEIIDTVKKMQVFYSPK